MAYANQTPTALLLAPCQCRVTHPWTLNPDAAKYYRFIWLAAGFQRARRRRRTRRVMSDATSHGDFNRILYRYERRPSNIVEFCSSCWKITKNTSFDIKSPVKNFYGRAKGWAASHRAPLNQSINQSLISGSMAHRNTRQDKTDRY